MDEEQARETEAEETREEESGDTAEEETAAEQQQEVEEHDWGAMTARLDALEELLGDLECHRSAAVVRHSRFASIFFHLIIFLCTEIIINFTIFIMFLNSLL